MATSTVFAVFEDFNDPRDEPASPPDQDAPDPSAEIDEIRAEAWTEGYMTGRREPGSPVSDQPLTAKLLTSVDAMGATATEAVDAASLVVADLLVTTVIALTADAWSARLLDRVRQVADRIKPALTVTPDFVLRDDRGSEQHFTNISDLARAIDAGDTGDDVTIRWLRGEATISRMALLEDLREAIIPLSVGRVNEQTVRNQS
jgi:hypothetical protein